MVGGTALEYPKGVKPANINNCSFKSLIRQYFSNMILKSESPGKFIFVFFVSGDVFNHLFSAYVVSVMCRAVCWELAMNMIIVCFHVVYRLDDVLKLFLTN